MKQGLKTFLNYLFLCLGILVFVLWIGWYSIGHFVQSIPNQITNQDLSLIKNRLEDAQELTTMKYHYTNMGHFEKQKALKDWKIPFTESEFILTYSGVIHTGVDLGKVDLSADDEQIVVKLPQAKILAHEVNEDSVEIINEEKSIFNPINVEDVTGLQKELKKKMEEEALDNGLLNEAQDYSQTQIQNLLEDILQGINPDIQLKIETAG